MNPLDEIILMDLTMRAINSGQLVRIVKQEKYFLDTLYLPTYFSTNFPTYSIDKLYASCLRLKSEELIEFAPSAYIKLKEKGASLYSNKVNISDFDAH